MTIDDRYRAQLQSAIAALRYWMPEIADVAAIRETDSTDYWRLSVTPNLRAQCPFEFVLRTDGQHDITIADEIYEDMETVDLDLFLALATAIANGHVIQRTARTEATGTPLWVETIVTLADGRTWTRRRFIERMLEGTADGVLLHDGHFLPFHRVHAA
ncbi:MAG: hypothetical protein AB7E80_16315 [Hyphomicrobiaceae bacterium]